MTTTPKFIRPHLSIPDAQIVADLLERHMEAQANWMQNALIHGHVERATELAKERDNIRNIFGKFNSGIIDSKREAEAEEADAQPVAAIDPIV
jgi:hypothetical protein